MATIARMHVKMEGEAEFRRVFTKYQKFNKRQPREIAVGKAYFIALNGLQDTKAASKSVIEAKLRKKSTKFVNAPLAAILVNKRLGKAGKKGLTGPKMAAAVEKFIKGQQSKTQAARSGWLWSVKTLDFWNKKGDEKFVKKNAPKKPQGVKAIGRAKGYAQVITGNGTASVTIANLFGQGKQDSKTIHGVLEQGLVKAVKRETASMISYINKKYAEEHARMNRK